jgi:hypothetical protein
LANGLILLPLAGPGRSFCRLSLLPRPVGHFLAIHFFAIVDRVDLRFVASFRCPHRAGLSSLPLFASVQERASDFDSLSCRAGMRKLVGHQLTSGRLPIEHNSRKRAQIQSRISAGKVRAYKGGRQAGVQGFLDCETGAGVRPISLPPIKGKQRLYLHRQQVGYPVHLFTLFRRKRLVSG